MVFCDDRPMTLFGPDSVVITSSSVFTSSRLSIWFGGTFTLPLHPKIQGIRTPLLRRYGRCRTPKCSLRLPLPSDMTVFGPDSVVITSSSVFTSSRLSIWFGGTFTLPLHPKIQGIRTPLLRRYGRCRTPKCSLRLPLPSDVHRSLASSPGSQCPSIYEV